MSPSQCCFRSIYEPGSSGSSHKEANYHSKVPTANQERDSSLSLGTSIDHEEARENKKKEPKDSNFEPLSSPAKEAFARGSFQQQVGFEVSPPTPLSPDAVLSERSHMGAYPSDTRVLSRLPSASPTKNNSPTASLLSLQLKRMNRSRPRSLKCLDSQRGGPDATMVGMVGGPDPQLLLRRSKSHAYDGPNENVFNSEQEFDADAFKIGIRFEAPSESSVLPLDEIEAMVPIPLPPAISSFPMLPKFLS